MTKFAEWMKLQCKCGGELFHEVKRMRWSQSGGTVLEPAGDRCESCGANVDRGKLIQDLQLRQKKAEVTAMQDEIKEGQPPTPADIPWPSSKE